MGVSENALLGRARGYLLKAAVLATLALLTTLLCASAAWADTFTVTTLDATGEGSLSEAIDKANSTPGADEVTFAPGVSGTIELNGTVLPVVTDPEGLTIDGGANAITVSGPSWRIFMVDPEGALSLKALTITGSSLFSGIINLGTLEIVDSTITRNHGGIINSGTMTMINSTVSGNCACGDDFSPGSGGGIRSEGTMTITNSTVSGNSTRGGPGGGIFLSGGTTTITNSTISNNGAGGFGADPDNRGGGIALNGGTMTITNSTVSGNFATSGSAIFNGNDIFGGNPGKATLRNTIVANNGSGGNCLGNPITDGGYNIDDDGACGFTQAMGSLSNTDPLLDPAGLADNGGPTLTIALQPQSPAVDLVGQEACPPPEADQRGVERPQGEACDSGAFELVQGPQTKADCKKGGYEEFGFKNQGRCVAFVKRAARNND